MNHTITCSCREDLCNRMANVKTIIGENLKGPADVSFCNNSDMTMADCIQLLKCLLANLELKINTHQSFDDYFDNISINEVEQLPRNKHSRLKHFQNEDNNFFFILIILVMVAYIVIIVVIMVVVNRPRDATQLSSEKSARLKASRAEAYNEERIEAGKIVQFRC
ncbi:unnamed protein product [Cylicocyclus nassatus]|uniref:Uncharacterized protein n=1 Tax=Cylicocyclus nassatus TaxID=53992 RepID=A0AA36DQL7_CYLNA|nr:unnamed protein product [Cylicocyclus nassatus]